MVRVADCRSACAWVKSGRALSSVSCFGFLVFHLQDQLGCSERTTTSSKEVPQPPSGLRLEGTSWSLPRSYRRQRDPTCQVFTDYERPSSSTTSDATRVCGARHPGKPRTAHPAASAQIVRSTRRSSGRQEFKSSSRQGPTGVPEVLSNTMALSP